MSELMHIAHTELYAGAPPPDCVAHTEIQEVYFADDTICFSANARTLETLLHKIEEVSARFGMEFNHDTCELLRLGTAMD
eukprot:4067066-Prorocentrum_lima.AAC.1